ncbi:MAG: signal peptidase I [Clostridia bacterium]|nr:signal peptidase I [Clostridia bacterium]
MTGQPRKTADIAKVIARRRQEVANRQDTWALVRRVLLLAAVLLIVLTQVFLVTRVEGTGMFPALKDGDLVMVYRLQSKFSRGDVIAYQHDGERYFGRIVAQGGDEVTISDTGTLLVNGRLESGEILFPTNSADGQSFVCKVPQGYVFVLGDYRTQTQDSRDFGCIPLSEAEGKVITLLRRRGL